MEPAHQDEKVSFSAAANYAIVDEATPTISSSEFWTSSDKACPLSDKKVSSVVVMTPNRYKGCMIDLQIE